MLIDNSQAVNYCDFEESYWSTDYEVPHTFDCPDPRQGMSFFESCHDGGPQDRVWNYRCTDIGVTLNLFEVTDTTDFDATWTVNCPTNHVITGLWCEHDSSSHDRKVTRFRYVQVDSTYREPLKSASQVATALLPVCVAVTPT